PARQPDRRAHRHRRHHTNPQPALRRRGTRPRLPAQRPRLPPRPPSRRLPAMTALTRSFLLVAALAVIATGRGGATGSSAHTTASTTATPSSGVTSPATLRTAVRTAIHANLELSLYVLWNNRIPSWATSSTRGP